MILMFKDPDGKILIALLALILTEYSNLDIEVLAFISIFGAVETAVFDFINSPDEGRLIIN
jgi:hypothetical protein